MLDSGCDKSIIGRQLIPDHELTPTDLKLFAANGTPIPLVGAVSLMFSIDTAPFAADVVETENLDEFILGNDWLIAS